MVYPAESSMCTWRECVLYFCLVERSRDVIYVKLFDNVIGIMSLLVLCSVVLSIYGSWVLTFSNLLFNCIFFQVYIMWVGIIMVPQRCPSHSFQNLWICYVTRQKRIKVADGIKIANQLTFTISEVVLSLKWLIIPSCPQNHTTNNKLENHVLSL